ncbi:primosomal protein N' [uncultured Eubacterium sp.]|uniref:replication restart helicase PriA n=1 Tax=uncultured Eubacterium sp. TaxID=165185 RepID=UPI0025D12610|nr:primosomal protein N' [uncultured Eubacterium sp.]
MDKNTLYANIIIDISHEKLDRTFQYRIPEELKGEIHPGIPVEIPFGRGNRSVNGYVVEVTDRAELEPSRLKPIRRVLRDGISIEGQLITLAAWIRENFGGTMNQALKTVIPVKQKTADKEKRLIWLKPDAATAKALLGELQRKHQTARARLMEALLKQSPLPYETVTQKLNITASVIRAMQERELIRVETVRNWRNPLDRMKKQGSVVALNPTQQRIVDEILTGWQQGDLRPCLIHGVTGSGKTEVYMEIIESVVKSGRQAIVLIPEIALTFQTVLRFYNHFGDRVSILNSRMSAGERSDQFERAKNGLLDVVIGPRSALFTPFPNLGVIIMDEEHEAAYKSESVPRYHARETAIARAKMCGAGVVLGSATPSVESYDRAKQGIYRLLVMKERVSARPLPTVYTVDLREELRNGNRSIFSDKLRELINDRLEKKEQIMLFLNRRGVAGFVSCRSCGEVIKCPHCDVSLNLHNNGKLVCHYCGYEQPMVKNCPSCGSPYIGGFKAGTQKIEQSVNQQFPGARVLRMDLDTTRKKDGYEQILSAFANHEADILIGTQMIVKGHDFPNVTLVGILAADLSLHISDYRAPERTFQLLTQAAGRAGRGCRQGEVVIQTYQPEHYSVVTAAAQDYEAFFEQEIFLREMLHYPPKWHMLVIHAAASQEMLVKQAQDMLKCKILTKTEEDAAEVQVIGPADAVVSKVNDIFRKVLYIKAADYRRLVSIKNMLETYISEEPAFRTVTIQFDFDPMNGF